MIPFIRSFTELMALTKSRDGTMNKIYNNEFSILTEENGQRKRYIRSRDENFINLPQLPKRNRKKWIKSKEALTKILNDLDYNNQIQSSYDLTLIARQNKIDKYDAA